MRQLDRRGAFPAVALLAGALVVLPAQRAAAAPSGYAVTTAGAAARVVSTQQPAFSIATGDLVDQTLGLVSSSFGPSTSEARAASYYPGDLLAQAGQLICGQFGPCPVDPPTYPLLAEASWPTAERATAGRGAGTASATAAPTANSASTTATEPPAGLSVGSSTSTTRTTALAGGLHVHIATTLHDVALGPLAIAMIAVNDDVVVDADGRTAASPHVVVGGASVAGRPVELGSTPLPELVAKGLEVRVVGTEASGARSRATGVRIDVTVPVRGVGAPVPGLPTLDRTYVGSLVLGDVSVLATRDDILSLSDLPLPGAPPSATGGTPSPAAVVAPGSSPVPPAGRRPATPPEPVTTLVLRTLGLERLDLGGLYAVLVLGALAGFVVTRRLTSRAWS